ncbi:serine/threonine-protein kinase [Sulfidibacter corallicola]|uniref:Serine/threonine protein kinase n=1 Tax=Sulfidibacter corallicola TaxID=2818388 RepID=A0A8A4TLL0_SULCO|nr:serine/threonine-protein kinase [Sulfidibacter corallicola]QTD49758.1 serine/threonine protein kinase [Sulfidibacter corallicola]
MDSLCGPFRIIDKLGEGGMGSVYLAVRDEFPDLKVALKTLSSWNPQSRSRFQRECHILSGLKHAGIAHLMDAGVLPNGQPWLAMEYVQGETLDVWLRQNQPGLKERLALFLKICDAMSHAHQQMVIHRDVKPGNIIIQPNGNPKLLDFGIAATLDPDTGEQAMITGQLETRLTPQYASPEQISSKRLSAASDVYSLGVVLYELLTGALPYHLESADPFEIYRIINEAHIVRPSKLRGQSGGTTGKFTQQLRGDLDIITLKALERDPDRRYSSVEALASDLRLFLLGLPIRARPATNRYRLRKFLRRHPWPVGVAFGLVFFLSYFAIYARHQSAQTARQRDLAESRLETSERMTQFLVSMFEQVDPDLARNREVSALEVMENGRRQIGTGLADDPRVQVLLMTTMARVYRSLGHYEPSRDLLTEAVDKGDPDQAFLSRLELISTLQSAGDYDAAQRQLAIVETEGLPADDLLNQTRLDHSRGKMWFLRGQYQDAKEAFAEAAANIDLLPVAERSLLLSDRAELQLELGHYEQAIEQQKQLLTLRQELYGEQHSQVAETLADLSMIYTEMDQYDQAEAYMNQSEEIYRQIFGERHPHLVNCLLRRGLLARLKGESDPAAEHLREAQALARDLLGEDHPVTANVLNHLAILHRFTGDYEASETLLKQALDIRRRVLGADHPQVALCLDSLAYLMLDRDDLAAAEAMLRRALEIKIARLGEKHPAVADSIEALAQVYSSKNDFKEAEPLLRKALGIKMQVMGENHRVVTTMLNNLASILQDRGDFDAAEPLYRRALANTKETLGEEHLYVAIYQSNLAGLLRDKGNHAEAQTLYREALRLIRTQMGEDHPYVPTAINNLAKVLHYRGDFVGAESLFREALAKSIDSLGEDHTQAGALSGNLGTLLVDTGDYAGAKPLLHKALEILQEKLGPRHRKVNLTLLFLGHLARREGNLDRSERYYRQVLESYEAVEPENRPNLASEHMALARLYFLGDRLDAARAHLEKAEAEVGKLQHDSPQAGIWFLRARLLRKEEENAQAQALLHQALQQRRERLGDRHPLVAEVLLELAQVLTATGRPDEAWPLVDQAAVALASLPAEHESHQVLSSVKGLILFEQGNEAEGEELMRAAHRALTQHMGETHYLTLAAQRRMQARRP